MHFVLKTGCMSLLKEKLNSCCNNVSRIGRSASIRLAPELTCTRTINVLASRYRDRIYTVKIVIRLGELNFNSFDSFLDVCRRCLRERFLRLRGQALALTMLNGVLFQRFLSRWMSHDGLRMLRKTWTLECYIEVLEAHVHPLSFSLGLLAIPHQNGFWWDGNGPLHTSVVLWRPARTLDWQESELWTGQQGHQTWIQLRTCLF